MTHVHKETQFGFTHLLSMDMGLQTEVILLTMTAIGQILPNKETEDDAIEEYGPCGAIPRTMDDHGKLALWGFCIIALSLDTEAVGALRQMGERKHIQSLLQTDERLAVDTI